MGAAIAAAWAGIRTALKDVAKSEGGPGKPASVSPGAQSIIGGTIMETTTMLMWSESNRTVAEALDKLNAAIASLTHAINYNTDAERATSDDLTELRHQIERLRDKM